jgi:hypothetical protein
MRLRPSPTRHWTISLTAATIVGLTQQSIPDPRQPYVLIPLFDVKGRHLGHDLKYPSRLLDLNAADILTGAIKADARSILLIHNHQEIPAIPSSQDLLLTAMVCQLATLWRITVHDHIIVGPERTYYSFRTHGRLP